MKNLAEKISASELEVMQVLWEAGDALPLAEIRKSLQARFDWSDPTVKTLIRRLCEKGVLSQEKRDVFYYEPCLSRDEYNAWAAGDMVNRLFKGSAQELVAALVKGRGLSRADIDELRAMFKMEDE
ncbi:MAG: BlaI/MecI/CopY family transcriptional regulator [Clostridia bacterium]|nr:BlaI/MecI/CopY family transcriptional regulator [Clostridia bacterium]